MPRHGRSRHTRVAERPEILVLVEPGNPLGLVGSLVTMLAFLFYGLLLHTLLRPEGRSLAMIMVALAVASVPVYMLSQVSRYAMLPLAADQGLEQGRLCLDRHRFAILLGAIFFGLWLLPLGLRVKGVNVGSWERRALESA